MGYPTPRMVVERSRGQREERAELARPPFRFVSMVKRDRYGLYIIVR